jgi:hypothetical protein
MKKVIILLFLFPSLGFGQRVFVTDNKKYAHFLVHRVNYFSEADWVIKKTTDYEKRNDKNHWYFVDHISNSDIVVYYTESRDEAEHFVFFTDNLRLIGNYPAHFGNIVEPIISKKNRKL